MSTTESDPIRDFIDRRLAFYRNDGIRLTDSAVAMLYYPLSDQRNSFNEVQASASIDHIIRGASTIRRNKRRPIQALDIIEAFWKLYCSIPPFCRPPER